MARGFGPFLKKLWLEAIFYNWAVDRRTAHQFQILLSPYFCAFNQDLLRVRFCQVIVRILFGPIRVNFTSATFL